MNLPVLRSHETADYKRCHKKWYWKWRRGLVPKAKKFGALDLGTWMHAALADWYLTGFNRRGNLADCFAEHANTAISNASASGIPEHQLDKAQELAMLGEHMAEAYQVHYGKDDTIDVIQAEIPLEFDITNSQGRVVARHKLKPDLVFRGGMLGWVWLMEHKTAAQIATEHLVIDGQARPYGVMAERALRKLGLIGKDETFKGIMYNFLRKALPDDRPTDGDGRSLNKDGSVSARQPSRQFLRHPVTLTREAKLRTLRNLGADAIEITYMAQALRNKQLSPESLKITPDKTCPRFCDYFAICAATEQGMRPSALRNMEQSLYVARDPYLYDEESTDERSDW